MATVPLMTNLPVRAQALPPYRSSGVTEDPDPPAFVAGDAGVIDLRMSLSGGADHG